MQWHHLLCAADKLPAELKEALDDYAGDRPEPRRARQGDGRRDREGPREAGRLPVRRQARRPAARSACSASEPIAKDTFRVAVEREIDTGAIVTRGAGYLHPKCVVENLENVGGDRTRPGRRRCARTRGSPPADLDARRSPGDRRDPTRLDNVAAKLATPDAARRTFAACASLLALVLFVAPAFARGERHVVAARRDARARRASATAAASTRCCARIELNTTLVTPRHRRSTCRRARCERARRRARDDAARRDARPDDRRRRQGRARRSP